MMMASIAALAFAASAPQFVGGPCPAPLTKTTARCGAVTVPENRKLAGGRMIRLNVVVLPARQPRSDLPPLFDLAGGPGLAATGSADFYLGEGAAYREHQDVVLVDQRGTGGSHPLNCPELDRNDQALFPPAAVARCRRALSASSDLRHYRTDDAAADLDSVRAALGYQNIDLIALSYGTTLALRYMGRQPNRVRAAVLMGVVPPSARPPQEHAPSAERAMRLLFEDCAADSRCHSAFPSPEADFNRAVRRLAGNRSLPPAMFAEKLRTLMYSAPGARRIPQIVHKAAAGDFALFKAATGGAGLPYANGLYLSVTCTESLALMDYPAAAAAARRTRFGDYRLKRQRDACAQWPAGEVTSDFLKPATSSSAVLMISGRLDPVAPPEWAQAAALSLPRSRQLVLRDGGHIIDGLTALDTCFDPLILRFLETADATALDASCFDLMRAPPFAIE
jgi:pimeloyl-ACP methyl ester carboxylesterase